MRILLLGATGSIGRAVLAELSAQGHDVLALARSNTSQRSLREQGVDVLRGDLRSPRAWSAALAKVDAIVHVAATFTDDMGAVDRAVVDAMIEACPIRRSKPRFIYTGGCWLYGATGDEIADEDRPFDPIPAFAWAVENARRLMQSGCFSTSVVHPAMVYDRDGGVFSRFLEKAKRGDPIEVWGALETRWPLVHRDDLGRAYGLVLAQGRDGHHYNVAAEESVPVGRIVDALGSRFGLTRPPIVRSREEVVAEQGDWAVGPTLDQGMSSRKIRTELGWVPAHIDACAEIG
jgi:nucleoside-diphosphate-sugar epimerase